MDITPLVPKGRQLITGYGQGGFKINQEPIQGSLLVFFDHTVSWNVTSAAGITLDDFAAVLSVESPIEILLVGTGGRTVFLDKDIAGALRQKNIALEVMDTGGACRTYNVLMSEERRVAAALIAV